MNTSRVALARDRKGRAGRQHLAIEALEPRLLLSVTILNETFESGSLATNGWTVGDSNASGTPAYWNAKAITFGGEEPHGGNWKGYCAGTGYGGDDNNPTYQNDMTAYMSRTIDLTNYVVATLTYWHLMPSTEASVDVGRVYIDSTVVGSRSLTLTPWTLQTVDLEVFLGGTHTLKFEFTSNSSTTAEGWYLDDILVTGEDDPDDTIGEAVSLGAVSGTVTPPAGQSISANIDVDMYSFTVAAGQRVAFDVDKLSGGLDSYLRLFDAAGNQLALNDNLPGPAPEYNNKEAYLEYTFAAGGTYYVGVSGSGNPIYNPLTGAGDVVDGVGTYDLILTDIGPDPAGTIGLAMNLGTIPSGGSVTHSESLNPNPDVDMYAFTVAAGQRLGFDTDQQSAGAPNTILRLFDAAGTQLASNDDGWGPDPDGGVASGESYIEYVFNTAGTYYIGVSGAPNGGYNPLTGTPVVGGDVGWYDLILRDMGRYVGQIPVGGGGGVYVYDCDLVNDIVLGDVAVVPGTGNAVSSITLVGTQQKTGLGIAVWGASSVGKVSDKRSLPGDLAFFVSYAPVASLALRGNLTGFNINGLHAGGLWCDKDLDLDGDTTDRTALCAASGVSKLSLTGNLGADAVIGGDLASMKITGSIAGDVYVTGSIPKPSVTGNWAGRITANWIGSPKITGTLSGSITTGLDPNGLSIGKLSAGQIGNLVVNVGGGISGITAASWADGSLTASWLASLSIAGNCGADVTLNSNQAGTLGKGSIAGTLQDAVWNIWGPVSSLAVGRWGAGSRLAVRVYPGGDGTYFTGDDSTSPPLGSIAKLTIAAFETAHDHDFGILAAAYTSIKLGTIVPVLPFANNQFRIVRVV